jgi:methyl-accepting chemotaxis protein
MSEDVFRIIVTVAVCLACISFIVQAGIVFGIYRATKVMQAKVTNVTDRAEPILDSARRIVDEARPKINAISDKALEVTTIARQQVARYDELLTEAADRARVQIERIDSVLEETVGRVQETTAAVQTTVLRPVREIHGVVSGVRAAISTLSKGNRPSVDHATQDEEMFI